MANSNVGRTSEAKLATPNCPEHVAEVLDRFPQPQRSVLWELRELIIETHADNGQVGQLREDLRWGQPSFLTERPQTGSTIRLGSNKAGKPTLYCHCGTTLIGEFRERYPDVFDFEGNRALVLKGDVQSVVDELRHCIARALTYKLPT